MLENIVPEYYGRYIHKQRFAKKPPVIGQGKRRV